MKNVAFQKSSLVFLFFLISFSTCIKAQTLPESNITDNENWATVFNTNNQIYYRSVAISNNQRYATTYNARNNLFSYTTKGWELVPVNFNMNSYEIPSLSLHKNELYIAFSDNDAGNKLSVMKLANNKWESIGKKNFSSGSVNLICLAFNEDIPFVAFQDI